MVFLLKTPRETRRNGHMLLAALARLAEELDLVVLLTVKVNKSEEVSNYFSRYSKTNGIMIECEFIFFLKTQRSGISGCHV
jgi:glycine cleavage system regulatory protein